jgi:hypothetical protein
MRRRAWSGLTLASFILAILVGGVWLRSYIQLDQITRKVNDEPHYKGMLLAWSRGRVQMGYAHCLNDPPHVSNKLSAAARWAWDVDDPVIIRSGRSTANRYGFTALAGTSYHPPSDEGRGGTWTKYSLVLPCWFLFLVSMVLPGLAWHRGRKKAMTSTAVPLEPPLLPV